ncbi:hypothetical protein CKAN_00705500 [Cinnamomum micranthum f. kanehirae]|uniref:Uncharacterized protein n=1 Tax=Cinnamomum micranthum f. kanehirae TaxID=337451 RepID=A0A443NJ29_9MAGN|nr:hypothetical protein CKAN_00705500 [Cinnamomum micranthum f. kanehirae]
MGNDWKPRFDSSSSSPSSTRPSSPGITKSTSNEGMHSGTATAFSSRLDEVSPNGQILPFTPTLKIFSFAELKKATIRGEYLGEPFSSKHCETFGILLGRQRTTTCIRIHAKREFVKPPFQ